MESARRAVKDRIVKDMVGAVKDATGGGWKVLVVDDLTTRVLSATCKLSDIQDCNVSVVEDLNKVREPMSMPALYFIQPTPASVARLVADFEDGRQQYPSVHIFFSSKAPAEAVERIKNCPELIAVLKTLKESNLEFLTVDSRSVITDHPMAAVRWKGVKGRGRFCASCTPSNAGAHALNLQIVKRWTPPQPSLCQRLMGERCEVDKREAAREMESIITRMATVFATLNEFPSVRYKQGKAVEGGEPPGATARSTLTARMASGLHDRLAGMQRAGSLPNKETCDLLVLDRSFDPVTPVIHDWTYEAMVYDLLEMDGNVFRFKTEAQNGRVDEKEVLLEEHDELWLEMRHAFIADVYTSLATKFKDFQGKNKAAKLSAGLKDKTSDMTTSNIRALIQALPQFREFLSRLSLHIQVSSEIRTASNERQLTKLGELEQDLVFGEQTQKDLLAYLTENHSSLEVVDKMRLFMCYLATHPGKLDPTRRSQWQKVSKLSSSDMAAMCNLAFFGVNMGTAAVVEAKSSSFFGRNKSAKAPSATRKKREDANEDRYRLSHYEPLLLEVLEDVQAGRLSQEEYPYVKPPQQQEEPPDVRSVASARTARSGLNWARRNVAQEAGAAPGASPAGRRLVIFIIGGMTRSEMRVVHQIARSSGRDVVIASTSVETPQTFIDTLYKIGGTATEEGY